MFMPEPLTFSADPSALVANAAPGDNAAPFSISEFSALLKRAVEERFGFVRLRGELSGFKRAASGHLYCCLKDEGAVIDGVMWRTAAQRLAFAPEDGVEVIATGRITTFPGRSRYQIVIERMEIAGEGALLALLAKTRDRLAAEGLFDAGRKRAIPFLPRVIGVITSPTGAVIRDILHRLAGRFPSRVIVWPVAVQGAGAGEQVAAALAGFSALSEGGAVPRPDVVIVARGGGSVEDLWAFNEEVVVRAIAASTIPVISAVGHETDTTLADFVADLRAPTPTAAAELVVPVRNELLAQLAELGLRKQRCALRPVTLGRERLDARVRRLPRPEALLAGAAQRLDGQHLRLATALRQCAHLGQARLERSAAGLRAQPLRARVTSERRRLERAAPSPTQLTRRLAQAGERLASAARLLAQLDPDQPLVRGFARVIDTAGRTLASRAEAEGCERLVLKFRDGDLPAAPLAGHEPRPPARKPRQARAGARQGDLF
jgi:exodeoxyribonuclease VII large subunit